MLQTRIPQNRSYGALIGAGVLGLFLLIGGVSSCASVDAGEVGLKNTQGSIGNEVLEPGLHLKAPFITSIETMSVQSQRKNGKTPIYTADMQTAEVQFAVTYALDRNSAARMRKTVGHEWEGRLIPPVVESSIKSVFGRVSAVNAIANRNTLQSQIESQIRSNLQRRGINVESFALTNIDYSDAFEGAVERAQVATQNAVAAKNQTVTIREEALQKVIAAEADAKAMSVKSQALANSPGLTQYELARKWNGVLPTTMVPGSAVPFINVK